MFMRFNVLRTHPLIRSRGGMVEFGVLVRNRIESDRQQRFGGMVI
jgi:hypothetical protein